MDEGDWTDWEKWKPSEFLSLAYVRKPCTEIQSWPTELRINPLLWTWLGLVFGSKYKCHHWISKCTNAFRSVALMFSAKASLFPLKGHCCAYCGSARGEETIGANECPSQARTFFCALSWSFALWLTWVHLEWRCCCTYVCRRSKVSFKWSPPSEEGDLRIIGRRGRAQLCYAYCGIAPLFFLGWISIGVLCAVEQQHWAFQVIRTSCKARDGSDNFHFLPDAPFFSHMPSQISQLSLTYGLCLLSITCHCDTRSV